jgi:hypothetical protein
MGLDAKTYWLTDRQSQCHFDFDFVWESCQELDRVMEMAVQGDWEEMASKKLDCEKTSCVIWSDSETVINLLPGYG